MEFSRQEYWSRLPFPTPGDLPNPWIKPGSLASPALAGGFFTTSAEIIYLRLGLEPTWLGLKPSQNPVWDLNPAKTHSTWFQELRFLMSHHRKNSVTDKVIGKKWIYSDTERSTLQTECGPSQSTNAAAKFGVVSFYKLGNFICLVFLYFFVLIAEEGFLMSPCCSLELCIQMLLSFLFSFAFRFSSFHSYL